MHRLHEIVIQKAPNSAEPSTKINSYNTVSGLSRQVMLLLTSINQYNRGISYRSDLSGNALFSEYPNFFLDPLLPSGFNAYMTKVLYTLKLLAARSYKAIRMAKRRPVHGQRRWRNAKMARRCNSYLYYATKAYELDLFNYRQTAKFKWTHTWELRQKAKMKKKVVKKKWTKFRKFGERRLAVKKQKKTPWN